MTMETALLAHRLVAHHGPHLVLNDVTFGLRAGRVTAVLGRNGAGKTTLIRTLMGLHSLTRGNLKTLGQDVTSWRAWRRNRLGIGLVPQGRHVFGDLTVSENLAVIPACQDSMGVEELLTLFPRLAERARLRAKNLSGGEQQMLAIARALRAGPKILLLDEPSEGLAPLIVDEVCRLIDQLRQRQLTILLAEQNLHLAFEVADDALVLDHGRIVHQSTMHETRGRPDILQAHLGV